MARVEYLMGLPRSGNTLLSSLLNQHPEIYSSPLSVMPDIISTVCRQLGNSAEFMRNPNYKRADQLVSSLQESYYKDVKKPVIIDRSKFWFFPSLVDTIYAAINPSPKFVYTVRPLIEILASYVNLEREFPTFDGEMASKNIYLNKYSEREESWCDYLVYHKLDSAFYQLSLALSPRYRDSVFFVTYDDLVSAPEVTMRQIYEFLEVDSSFTNDFNDIKKIDSDNDQIVGMHPNTHTIRQSLSKSNFTYEDVLPDRVIRKYSLPMFWDGVSDVRR